MPDQVDASYTLSAAPKFPKFTGTYSLDTEQDEKGGLGEWSIAQRDAKGQMQVTPFYGAQNVTLDGTCVMHFAKYDLRVLDAFGMKRPKNVVDTHIAAYALGLGRQDTKDTGKSGSAMVGGLGLKYLARRHLGLEMKTWQQVKDQPEIKPEYNATDSVATLLLWEKWAPILPDHFWKIDMPLLDVLMAMEDRGIMVDPDFLRKYSEHLDTELAKIELPLNPFSYKEKAEYVYKTLGLPVTKFTENKQPSVDKEVLETIDDPIIRRIIQYMELYKERGTYVQNYSKGLDENNRLHCEFKQTSTATSRLSSARPNLQNVTTSNKSELRKLFVAPEGKLLVVLDYKKLEFGVQAAITKDPTMIEAFLADKIHQETADALGVSYDDGKRINFLIQNGGDAWKICLDFHIPIDVARKHVANYYKRFPAIARYHAQQKAIAKEKREVVNFFGRKRRLDAMFSEHWKTLREGEKEAMATPIQGSAAEVVKLAMIDLHYKHHAPMVSQVHDEILFEVPEKEAKEYAKWLEEYVPKLTEINGIYFPVSVGVGKNWAEAKH
uniref:Putative DNA polymerase n=1 Tax=viral metagenome TaxID=1070528 RepID=A0A6M3K0T2_9ZZZZ